jgi:hypothetical protein
MAAAENEVANDPDRFVRTYFDPWDISQRVNEERRFLILGPKGSGKSAAARYIDLRLRQELGDHAVFSNFVDFDELNRTQSPLTSLDRKLVGEVTSLVDAAWKVFLGVRLLESVAGDPASDIASEPRVVDFLKELREAGLASDDYPHVLRRVRERRGTIALPGWLTGERKSTETDQVSPAQLGDALLGIVARSRTPNQHLLVIDGLDKAIGDNPAYWQTMAALVRVADAFRRALQSAAAPHVKLMVLCRSDVFRRVRFADAAKIAADGGCHLEWNAESADPRSVLLWDYLCQKAGVDRAALFSLFPAEIAVGRRGQRVPFDRYLLQFTRYTPRDMTLLFKEIQLASGRRTRPTGADVRRGVDHFSGRHLVSEVISEAHGLLPEALLDRFDQIISSLPARIFTADDLSQSLEQIGLSDVTTVDALGEYLFLQGAIGNYLADPEYVQFYHRRDAYQFERRGPWVLHTALVYAFNVPWMRPRSGP